MSDQLDGAAVRAQVAALALGDDATRRRVICALVGHSRIVDEEGEGADWHFSCARCGAALADVSMSAVMGMVVRGRTAAHWNHRTSVENSKILTWRDLWEVQLGPTDGRTA